MSMENIQSINRQHFNFELLHQDNNCRARARVIHTPHGDIPTPVLCLLALTPPLRPPTTRTD